MAIPLSSIWKHRGFIILVFFFLSFVWSVAADHNNDHDAANSSTTTSTNNHQNLYDILGVPATATMQEIKSAYRRQALATHPDKRPDVPAPVAAAEFQTVVMALEILTDERARKDYDESIKQQPQPQQQQQQQQKHQQQKHQQDFFHTAANHRKRFSPMERSRQRTESKTYRREFWYFPFPETKLTEDDLKDNGEVQQAMSRVIHVHSLAQLELLMTTDAPDGILERSVLLCIVTQFNHVDHIAKEKIFFPYPFAGYSAQKIWWEDILQTIMYEYDDTENENDKLMQQFFDLPKSPQEMMEPILFFGKRGDKLLPQNLRRFQTSNWEEFNSWVWNQLQVHITFVNLHKHPVELFWMQGNKGTLKATIPPGMLHNEVSMVGHEWRLRDARVDRVFPTQASALHRLDPSTLVVKQHVIVSDDPHQTLIIKNKPCIDLSSQCRPWAQRGECTINPTFMEVNCPVSCTTCDKILLDSSNSTSAEASAETNTNFKEEL
jgi:hypothetical protein